MTEHWKEQMAHGPTKDYYDTMKDIIEGIGKVSFLMDEARPPKFRVLEIGTAWGISGRAFVESDLVVEFHTVDPNHESKDCAKGVEEIKIAARAEGQKIVFHTGYSWFVLPVLLKKGEQFDIVYIDGSHDYDDVKLDIECADKLATRFIIIDDFLHLKNLDQDSYGVIRAARELLISKGYIANVVPTKNNGTLVIDKKFKNNALVW